MPKAAKLKLECLEAKYGDCFIIHYSNGEGTGRILLDGGPKGVYNAVLKPRLEALAAEDKEGVARFVLGVVTHIDDDHINGLVALTNELSGQKDVHAKQYVQFDRFWHNNFERLADPKSAGSAGSKSTATVRAQFEAGRLPSFKDERTAEILASVEQGQDLSRNLEVLGLSGNEPFYGLVSGPKTFPMPDGPKVFVIGPTAKQLEALKRDYEKELGGPVTPAGLAAYVDRSVPNVSSIVFLIEYAGKRMLFTGDARGDDILTYLKEAKLLDAKGTIEVNVLKLPHHGSKRNLEKDFFAQVLAKTYVISANGANDNPDAETIEWLAAGCEGRKCKTVFTNMPKMKTAKKQREFDEALAKLKKAGSVEFREIGKTSIFVDP